MNVYGISTFKQTIRIEPSTINTQAGINIFGGSNLDNTWFVGRGAYNVGQNNFVIGSDYLPVINNGITQQRVGFQINADAQAYFTGKVNALGGLTVSGDFNAPNNAYITTLQVNLNAYIVGELNTARIIAKASGAFGTIRCYPSATFGESSIGFYRNNNGNLQQSGDFWAVGHQAYNALDRNFGIGCNEQGV